MEKPGLVNAQEARKLYIQRYIQSLVHACQCRDANCRLPSCQKMKRIVQHTKICKRKTKGDCLICKQLLAICCYHAKHCQETKCSVPFCISIKQKLKQQQARQRVQQQQFLRRRMAAINMRGCAPPPPRSKPSHTLPYNVQKVLQQLIQGPDPLVNCDLMYGRDAFLNSCKLHVKTRYHYTVCDDFDPCVPCHDEEGHPHKMEKLELDLDVGSSLGDMKQANPQEAKKLSILRCIQSLMHACQCRDANCRLPSCQKMKMVVQHTKICKQKTKGDCPICKQLIALCCYHAKHCQETKCSVPFCSSIKQKLKQQQAQQRVQQQQLLRRCMAAMNMRGCAPPPYPPPPSKPSHTLPHNVQKALKQLIQGPDPLVNCDLMYGRDAFLNSCKSHVKTRYHYTVCDDFDLCVPCHDKEGPPHKMEKLELDLDVGSSPGDMKQANPQEARKLYFQRYIQSLMHACQCRDANCRLPSCQKMKMVVQHTKICKRKSKGDCLICKQLLAICCYHAKHCQETKCSVPFCSSIKQKLKQVQ